MDDLRKFALDIAATAIRGAPFTEIVEAAEAFHAFLSGQADDERVVRPPPLPSNADLAKADQSPARFGIVAIDEDNNPTRLVRPPNDAA
jgi:hypothetical protein